MSIHVTKTEIHAGDRLSGEDLADHDIEKPENRESYPEDQGQICLSIRPGTQLGQLYLNVQFEAKTGSSERCMQGQNEYLKNTAEWLKEILTELGGHWDIALDGLPCPKTPAIPIKLAEAAGVLQGEAPAAALGHVAAVTVENQTQIG